MNRRAKDFEKKKLVGDVLGAILRGNTDNYGAINEEGTELTELNVWAPNYLLNSV